jgi:hypothetical protein
MYESTSNSPQAANPWRPPSPIRHLISRLSTFLSQTPNPRSGSSPPKTCLKKAFTFPLSGHPSSTASPTCLASCKSCHIWTPALRGWTSMIQSLELLQRSSSAHLSRSLESIAACPEHVLTLVPSCALGANDGAIIIPSAAVKVCAALSVEVLIARLLTTLLSLLTKWNTDIASTVPPQNGKSATIQP